MIGFGKYKKRTVATTQKTESITIMVLTDNRLIKIDPQEDDFFEKVLNFKSTNDKFNAFIEAISEIQDANIEPFYKPKYDPSEVANTITYKKGERPATGHSYNWWVKTASEMPTVEDRRWHLATEYQYYAFLVWLINQLVKSGKSVEEALNMVVYDSKELGHYYNSEDSTEGEEFELTGLRCTCGVYDLANAYKILSCSNEEVGGFWIGGGDCFNDGNHNPLANLVHLTDVDDDYDDSVGLLVL